MLNNKIFPSFILDNPKKFNLIKNIVDIHYKWVKWNKENNSQNEILCFTIREIESVIECLNNNEDIYDVIMTIYGGRYRKNINKEKDPESQLKKIIESYGITKEKNEKIRTILNEFKYCYINENLIKVVNSILICLKNKQNIILLGNNESGLTQIAEWCAKYFNTIKGPKDGKVSICYFTMNLECKELIGTQKL